MRPLIEVADLADLLRSGANPVRLLDVRWRLDRPDGRAEHLAGHIPGAVYVSLDDELAAHGRPATEGRHPLPDVEDLQDAARRWGIDDGDPVVAYDDLGGMSAARAWWLLRHAGIADVRVLDGGLSAWIDAGLPVETGEVVPARGAVTLEYGGMPTLDADAAARFPERGTLIDARAAERYRGETEPIDPRAGHIPGAVSVPTAGSLSSGRLLPSRAVTARFADAGVDLEGDIGVYCGSGVTAAHEVLVLETLGVRAALFPGSWSAWSSDPSRPVAVGSAR